jgi:hypothetical protein
MVNKRKSVATGFFSQVGEAALPLSLGKNYMVYLQKGDEKT